MIYVAECAYISYLRIPMFPHFIDENGNFCAIGFVRWMWPTIVCVFLGMRCCLFNFVTTMVL